MKYRLWEMQAAERAYERNSLKKYLIDLMKCEHAAELNTVVGPCIHIHISLACQFVDVKLAEVCTVCEAFSLLLQGCSRPW